MQISTQQMKKKEERQITERLHVLLADLKTPREVHLFLRDFLTETEYTVLAKRLTIAYYLSQGRSYSDIRKQLRVSSATISGIRESLESKGMKMALNKMKVDEWATRTVEKIQSLFNKNKGK